MKTRICLLSLFLICLGTLSSSYSAANEKVLPVPKIKCGTASLSGKFVGINELKKQYSNFKNLSIYCSVINPLTGRTETKKIEIKADESFSLEIPVEVSHVLGRINLGDIQYYLIPLVAGEETKFDITIENQTLGLKWISGPDFIFGDALPWGDALMKALDGPSNSTFEDLEAIKRAIAEPKEYASYGLNIISSRLGRLTNNPELTKPVSEMSCYIIKLLSIDQIFDYRGGLWNRYKEYRVNSQRGQGLKGKVIFTKNDSIAFYPSEPNASYFSFLKELNLNDSRYLYCGDSFGVFSILQQILKNEKISIPSIGETPIDKWLEQAKTSLTDLVGFSDGIFYDMLVCNAYARQFVDKQEPLSAQQIKNIQRFYKGGEVEKVLLRENERIKSPDKGKKLMTEKEMSQERGEQLVNSIVAKYRGKAVVVDFWATWCGPCLKAMKEIDLIKSDYSDKDVVFVYITTESSPKDKWEAMTPSIKGEHYYLAKAEWNDVANRFFDGIPAYVFYDKKGDRVDNMVSYPGNDRMKELIDEALGK